MLAALAVMAAVFYSMLSERVQYLRENGAAGMESLKAYDAERKDIEALMGRLQELRKQPGRVFASGASDLRVGSVGLHQSFPMFGIPAVGIPYHSFGMASERVRTIQESRPGDLNLFGVRYVVAEDWPMASAPSESFGRFKMYRVSGGGMFSVISIPLAWEGDRTDLWNLSSEWMESRLMPLHQHIAVYAPGKAPKGRYRAVLHAGDKVSQADPSTSASEPQGVVADEVQQGEDYSAAITVDRPAYVLFKSSFHQGLRAAVDGVPVQTLLVTPGMLAFPVPSGQHRVKVWYQPMALKYVLLFVGIAGVLALALQRKNRYA